MLIQPNAEMVRATWFACKCFGITAEGCNLAREDIKRAIANNAMTLRVEHALSCKLYWFLRAADSPIGFSWSRNVCDATVSTCLGLYRRLRPRLSPQKGDEKQLQWLLMEKVWLPTFIAILKERRSLGHNNELEPSEFWYLADRLPPFQVAVDYWLRVAGLITAHGVARSRRQAFEQTDLDAANEEALRKRVGRWQKCALPKTLDRIFEDVDATAQRLERIERPVQMKGRLVVGFALQRVLNAIDKSFGQIDGKPASEQTKNLFFRLNDGRFALARHETLKSTHLQFALRLIWDRWHEEGWRPQHIDVSPYKCINSSDRLEDMSTAFEEALYRASPEAQFIERLAQTACSSEAIRDEHDSLGLEEFVLNAAAGNLTLILEQRLAATRCQP